MNSRPPRRPRRPLVRVCLAALLVLAACGGPRGVSLTELAVNADYYDGRDVAASGVVLEFGDEEGPIEHHYVIQDADQNRVELRPHELVAPHVGSAVEVVGEFDYDEDRGRVLHIDTIEAVTSGR